MRLLMETRAWVLVNHAENNCLDDSPFSCVYVSTKTLKYCRISSKYANMVARSDTPRKITVKLQLFYCLHTIVVEFLSWVAPTHHIAYLGSALSFYIRKIAIINRLCLSYDCMTPHSKRTTTITTTTDMSIAEKVGM